MVDRIAKGVDDIPVTGASVSVLQYIEARLHDSDLRYSQRFDAQTLAVNAAMTAAEKAISAALLAAEKAVTKAEMSSEKRFESVNEFRKTLSDQTGTFMPRAEADARFAAMSEKLDTLMTRMDKREGQGGGLQLGWTLLLGGVTLISIISAIFMTLSKG